MRRDTTLCGCTCGKTTSSDGARIVERTRAGFVIERDVLALQMQESGNGPETACEIGS
ncbi:hypothetical protein XYCOK13_41380 [Xylanibacillus composti]|uniref:Uncharacterized protein n=1 Tax=Xylanibacillus composti TaxID=1572762 RepID=A0A8J4M3X6_9BACL|nr:hypothetical protein XYCOK13_41380 [Xylanibacillus composti]